MSRIIKSFTVYSSQLTVNRKPFLKPAPESGKGNFSGRTNKDNKTELSFLLKPSKHQTQTNQPPNIDTLLFIPFFPYRLNSIGALGFSTCLYYKSCK